MVVGAIGRQYRPDIAAVLLVDIEFQLPGVETVLVRVCDVIGERRVRALTLNDDHLGWRGTVFHRHLAVQEDGAPASDLGGRHAGEHQGGKRQTEVFHALWSLGEYTPHR